MTDEPNPELRSMGAFSRRRVIAGAMIGSTMLAQAGGAAQRATAVRRVPLPDPAQIKRDYAELVNFGPRLPGNANHVRFVRWLADEFAASGLRVGPCEEYAYRHWDPRSTSLAIGSGSSRRQVRFPTHYVRSAPTGPAGVEGPLVYGGAIEAAGPAKLGDIPPGAIVVFDGRLPKATFARIANPVFVNSPEGKTSEYVNREYKRLWLTPDYRLDALVPKKAAGAVIIMDVSSDQIRGNYSPHHSSYQPPLPALFVGADTGDAIREAAEKGELAKLTLDAQWVDGAMPQLTAVLPGESDEIIIVNTHTDGQNFIEENGCFALLHLARHFASLPAGERLKRTVVFACWPGHMTGTTPEAPGWILAHPDLVKRAVAAFTIEHLGATEWDDEPGRGYVPTGRNERVNFAATKGPLMRSVIDLLQKFDLQDHLVQNGPGITVGSSFHEQGVPHVGCISGPSYLLGVVPNGHLDKLDAGLAARQTAMLAELIRFADRTPAADLRAEDPSLGAKPVTGPDTSRPAQCRAPRQPRRG